MILVKNRLNAGFFSNLNAALGWYWYSMRTDIPVHVHWDGVPNKNVFDEFFQQKYAYKPHDYENNANIQHSPLFTEQIKEAFKEDIGELLYNKYDNGWFFCKGNVYTEPDFVKLRRLYNYLYTENLKFKSDLIPSYNIPPKTLGINYRYIIMYFTNDGKMTPFKNLMSVEEFNKKYIEQIESTFENGKYEKIYIASSQRIFFEECLNKFKDKLLYLPMKRVEENQIEFDRGVSMTKECVDVLTDTINLTKCDHLLISPSNIIFAALYMNPNINYQIFDFLKETYTG
jgi:hypothetical protein